MYSLLVSTPFLAYRSTILRPCACQKGFSDVKVTDIFTAHRPWTAPPALDQVHTHLFNCCLCVIGKVSITLGGYLHRNQETQDNQGCVRARKEKGLHNTKRGIGMGPRDASAGMIAWQKRRQLTRPGMIFSRSAPMLTARMSATFDCGLTWQKSSLQYPDIVLLQSVAPWTC